MSLDLDKTDLKNNVLIITNDDGSIQCIPEDGATEDEKAMFAEFRSTYPNGKIIATSLDDAKQNKALEIEQACETAIISGFTSNAYQGIEKNYASTVEDQANITGNALSATSKIAGIAGCEDDKFYYHAIGEDFVEWTAEECSQLARDFKAFKEIQLFRSKALQNYINSLNTVDAVNAVTWDTEIPDAATSTVADEGSNNAATQGGETSETVK